MKEKNIKRIVRKQLKSNHPNWQRLSRKQKKKIAKEITDAVAGDYQEVDEELSVPVEELIGIEEQQVDSNVMTLQDMADFVNNFHNKAGLLKFPYPRKPWPEIHNKELQFIDELLNNQIINALLANEGYSPEMRGIFPCQLFRAELLKAIKYPEISYRKFCSSEYMGRERKENRRFSGLPLNTKELIDHTQLSHFRRDLKFSQLVNIPVYILHHLYDSGLLEECVLHGVDSTEIANDNRYPLYSIKVGDKKVRVYSDIDCDCGARRGKRDKSSFVAGYRMHTLTAINPSTGLSYPLVSLLGPADRHDSLYLKPLVDPAQAIGIDIKLISADNACHDKEGALPDETGVHLITPVSNDTSLPEYVEPGIVQVTCDQFCEIPMTRMGLTNEGHEYKCAADAGECPRSAICPRFRLIAFDDGHFQKIPVDNEAARQAVEMRKNCERPFNLMKKREGLEDAVVRSQHALCGRMTFTMITTLLIELAGFRRKKAKDGGRQLELFEKAA